jgi:hypothetical protein
MSDIEGRLSSLSAVVRERELLGQRGAALAGRRAALEVELAALHEQYAVEQRDVDRLEGLSLTRVLVALRGARQDTLARERAEADAARYRVAETLGRLDAVRGELGLVEQRLAATAGAPADYAAVLDEKERAVRAAGTGPARRLAELADERGRAEAESRELAQAQAAADQAAGALVAVRLELRGAAGWSTYDTFFGGGAFSSAVKHGRLDAAADKAARADRCLAVLREELADVGVTQPLSQGMRLSGLTRFADVWFDNVFTDLDVSDQIKTAQARVEWAELRVAAVLERLAARSETVAARRDDIARERDRLLRPSL